MEDKTKGMPFKVMVTVITQKVIADVKGGINFEIYLKV